MVSIIVPVYNSEHSLSDCVFSLLNQSEYEMEVILVDDGSTDASPAICDSFADSRVRVLHKKNGGISSARNAGLDMARGEWVTFCDNDDKVSLKWIERMLIVAEKDENVLPMCAYTRDSEKHGAEKVLSIERNRIYETSEYLTFYEQGIAGFVWNTLFRRDIIEEHHIRFSERKSMGDINEDLIFQMMYLSYIKGLAYTGFYDYLWNVNETNHSNETTEKWYFEKYEEKYRVLREWIKTGIHDEDGQMKRMATMMLYHLVWAICHESNFEKMKKYVENDVVQECVHLADCSGESQDVISYIREKKVKFLFLKLKISKLIKKLI